MMAIKTGHARTEIRVGGVFDIAEAKRLASVLEQTPYADVRIDMTRVVELHDFAVALLGDAITGRRAPTAVVGLREHHARLLRRLGIAPAAAGPAPGVERDDVP